MIVSDVTKPQMDRAIEAVTVYNEFIELIPIESKCDRGYCLYMDVQKGDVTKTVLDTRTFMTGWFKTLKIRCDSNPRDF
ncbi:hypothetical protein [Brevibacillus migulae]|uniref:hypothetical protein n=1 Tax=Brevibacillus migulae TaxID=1644114 RepID=UPI00106DFF77|nr:hypothetical protein [Brevibacillus migulae]